MLLITERAAPTPLWDVELELTFELRQKSRLRTRAVSGEEVGLFLERGGLLADGDCLASADGRVVRVRAAPEALLHVVADTPQELCRAAYHLGNRHVHVEVGDGWLRLAEDHVLEDMLGHFAVAVAHVVAPFNPESGAYGGGHHHSHGKEADFQYAPKLHEFAPQR